MKFLSLIAGLMTLLFSAPVCAGDGYMPQQQRLINQIVREGYTVDRKEMAVSQVQGGRLIPVSADVSLLSEESLLEANAIKRKQQNLKGSQINSSSMLKQ